MTTPAVTTIVAHETTIVVTYDQTINSSTNHPGEGFTCTVNGLAKAITSAAITSAAVITLTVAGVISNEDTVLLSYDDSTSNITDAGVIAAPAFTDEQADNQSDHAALLAAVCNLNDSGEEIVTLVWSLPVTSVLGLDTGLSFKVNNVLINVLSVVTGDDQRQMIVSFPGGFLYSDIITFSYSSSVGDWVSEGYDIADITDQAVTNSSKLGTPALDYPLSSIIREMLVATNGTIDATVGLNLNFIDQHLVERYGPANVDFGGTFGVTIDNPAGTFIAQDIKAIKTGMRVTKKFVNIGHPDWAAVSAAEWQETITQRIATALNVLRTTDQEVVLGTTTVRQV